MQQLCISNGIRAACGWLCVCMCVWIYLFECAQDAFKLCLMVSAFKRVCVGAIDQVEPLPTMSILLTSANCATKTRLAMHFFSSALPFLAHSLAIVCIDFVLFRSIFIACSAHRLDPLCWQLRFSNAFFSVSSLYFTSSGVFA